MKYSRILATGRYLPKKILTNHDLEQMVDTSDEWIFNRTGIRQRHIADDAELSSDLAAHAARIALATAGIMPNDIDLIVVATSTPDKIFPSTACILQHKLEINNGTAAFDVQAVCSGFVYALATANSLIKTTTARRALVVGVDIFSRITDWSDRSNCILWGDGAGAIVLEASDTPGVLSTHLHADGRYVSMLHTVNKSGRETIAMEGSAVFRFAVNTMDTMFDEILATHDLQKNDIDWLIPHQANIRILAAAADKLELPMERVITTIAEHGNTSAASIPMALDVAIRDGRIQRGDMMLMEAFGGGLTWGSALVRY